MDMLPNHLRKVVVVVGGGGGGLSFASSGCSVRAGTVIRHDRIEENRLQSDSNRTGVSDVCLHDMPRTAVNQTSLP